MKSFLKSKEIVIANGSWHFDGMVVTFPLNTEDSLYLKHDYQKAVTRMVRRELGDEASKEIKFVV